MARRRACSNNRNWIAAWGLMQIWRRRSSDARQAAVNCRHRRKLISSGPRALDGMANAGSGGAGTGTGPSSASAGPSAPSGMGTGAGNAGSSATPGMGTKDTVPSGNQASMPRRAIRTFSPPRGRGRGRQPRPHEMQGLATRKMACRSVRSGAARARRIKWPSA